MGNNIYARNTKRMSGHRMLSGSGGFTLVEILVATVILSLGLLAVVSAMVTSREFRKRAEYATIASAIASAKMERLRSTDRGYMYTIPLLEQSSLLPPGNRITTWWTETAKISKDCLYYFEVTITYPEGHGTRRLYYEAVYYKLQKT